MTTKEEIPIYFTITKLSTGGYKIYTKDKRTAICSVNVPPSKVCDEMVAITKALNNHKNHYAVLFEVD